MAISSISIAAGGVQRASHQLEVSAGRIARVGAQDVDVSSEMVNVLNARTDFKANAKAIEASRDMSKALLDILA
ncbi:flagellar basal body rod C-terminal domain-containing protein [Devosia chinhatensis]|uniref:Flagellar basal-body/hook protein C-terminal domain-containing protein n=1 Tax=Devosia chinhatensis TaxID=429727 RepID=A0A0F5FF11_9HYPH|nr:flagellar basal body rod C-terminal domain-containing protein [Devosia chinhatensis]KKB07499.1 hypothetical protein VE26_12160 [Devosia chinhatensis]